MPLSTASPLLLTDPGFVFWAPLASTEPTHAALASTYDADTWPAAWINLGATLEGSQFRDQLETDTITVAEFFYPIRNVTTGRTGSFSFAMANWTLNNLKRCLNGGTIATVSGAGVTLSSSYTPASAGNEVRCMIGWESLDHTVRLVTYQTINTGAVEMQMRKGATFAAMACDFTFEVPSSGIPYKFYSAGTARLGT
jgi:hypothetical protein